MIYHLFYSNICTVHAHLRITAKAGVSSLATTVIRDSYN